MFNQEKEQVVEEVLEGTDSIVTEKISEENSPSTPTISVTEIQDYLNPKLFHEVKIVKEIDLIKESNSDGSLISNELEALYEGTFGDISEHSDFKKTTSSTSWWRLSV